VEYVADRESFKELRPEKLSNQCLIVLKHRLLVKGASGYQSEGEK
jgi:hypothetical protein